MPSGAKKRKAAKKKLQKQADNNKKGTNFDGSHSLGTDNDNDKSYDERESDVGEGERESSEEPVLNNHAEIKEVRLDEQNVMNSEVDVQVGADVDSVSETKNGIHKRSSSSSSSSSSSENNEVIIENEKPEVVEDVVEVEQTIPSSFSETIPIEESVKNVVSFPNESNIESEKKENSDEVVPSIDEKENSSSKVTNFVENIETKVIQVVSEGSKKLLDDSKQNNGEGLFPQSCGVRDTDVSSGDNHVKELETHKYVEEKPLISSVPLPVRRTSWTNCCGLFEVFSGGAGR